MKKLLKLCVTCCAMFLVQASVNSACAIFIHQAKLPEAAKQFRKF